MEGLLGFLFFLALIALVVGMIKPSFVIKWGAEEDKNRKNVIKYYGIVLISSFILFGIISDSVDYSEFKEKQLAKEQDEIIKKEKDTKEIKEQENKDKDIKLEKKPKKEAKKEPKEESEEKKEEPVDEEIEEIEEDIVYEIEDVNYLLMWDDYDEDIYKDKHIRIAGKVDSIGKKTISIREGLTGLTGNIHLTLKEDNLHQLDALEHDDYVIAVGKCSGQINVSDVCVEAVGEEALRMANEHKEEANKVFEEQRIEAQELEKEEMADHEIKAGTVGYENLIRDPSKYEGDIIKVTVKVSQIMGGGILTDAGYRGSQGSDEWH